MDRMMPSLFCRKTSATLIALTMMLLSFCAGAQEAGTLYRYVNEQGVRVINSSIPAEYAQNGYEIINTSGQVLKIVAPAPKEEEIKQANKEREILNTYNLLKRRYSSLDDIERAKTRRLESIKTSISILEGSISYLEDNINALVKQAADMERAGRKVHDSLLKQLNDTRAELEISEDLLTYRKSEFSETSQKYSGDIRDFIRGEQLEKALKSKELVK